MSDFSPTSVPCTHILLPSPPLAPLPPMIFVTPASPAHRTDRVMIIFPGGGYQKVMVTKEGTKVAEHFATLGYSSFVVNVSSFPPWHGMTF